jgi:hypothetical protein
MLHYIIDTPKNIPVKISFKFFLNSFNPCYIRDIKRNEGIVYAFVLLEFANIYIYIVFSKHYIFFCYNLQRIEVINSIALTIWSFSIIVANNESSTFILSLFHLILEFIETMKIFDFPNYL